MKLTVLTGEYSVLRLGPGEQIPMEALQGEFFSVTRTAEELSLVGETRLLPDATKAEHGFNAIKVEGPLDFSLTGILARLAAPLADAKISIFAVSTFDTDYVLVRTHALGRTKDVLTNAGFHF